MSSVFVSGSMRIKNLDPMVTSRLDNIIEARHHILVGDANGVDSAIQEYLRSKEWQEVTVYCTGNRPRNNIGGWNVESVKSSAKPGTREYFTAKDICMAEECDFGFMIWDTKSTGTLSNALELTKRNKVSLVYVNRDRVFVKLTKASDLESLISRMSDFAKKKADQKLKLGAALVGIKNQQISLFG